MTRIHLVASLSLVLSACAADIGDPAEQAELEETEVMVANAMVANAMVANALSANFDANRMMAAVPLNTESYDPGTGYDELKYALHDELTRHFFKYLFSCAADVSQTMTWKDPWTAVTYKFRGEMGYCSTTWPTPGGSADQACRERVSACLLSRVNGFGVTVRLSQRGHDEHGDPIALSDVVPAGNKYSNGNNVTPLTSGCPAGVVGAARECSWRASETGTCVPGTVVTVGLGAPPAASCASPALGTSYGADTVLRVCKDITGCKQTDSTYLGQANNTCGTLSPSVTFVCPASGFFTSMVGHNNATSTPAYPSWRPGVQNGMLGTEADVFSFQEASFYGNVFDADAIAKQVVEANIRVDPDTGEVNRNDFLVEGSVYTKMFACWSPTWTEGIAYATQRVCGGPTEENCAAQAIGACGKDNSATPVYPDYWCATDDDPIEVGDGDFQFCGDPNGESWEHALTVFLNHPCDLIPDGEVCANIHGMYPPNW